MKLMIPSFDRRSARDMLVDAGLRPTRKDCPLPNCSSPKGDRHVSAELLQQEAEKVNVSVSLATIYNTLHHSPKLVCCAKWREGNKAYFDTNTSDHHHFFYEKTIASSIFRWYER